MRVVVRLVLWSVLIGTSAFLAAQNDSAQATAKSSETTAITPSELEKQFTAVIRNGDALKFLSYVPDDGAHLGKHADATTRGEIEEQLTHRTGLYCKLFDSACLASSSMTDDPKTACSYRELLTQSEKVRTASSEITRNGVRQAILIAQAQNQKCGGSVLIDFIFNAQKGEWKLFSIP